MIQNFCDDILSEILKFLPNIDLKKFTQSSKSLNKIGYLKNLILNTNDDPFLFAKNFSKHNLTLTNIITYKNIPNIQNFMPSKWPNYVTIFYSTITDTLSPNANRTEYLKLYSLYESRNTLKINWKNFKNLKNLYIYNNDIILDGIEECVSLTNIFIFLFKKQVLNSKIGYLPKLKILITNCCVQKDTTFVSKDLELFVSNNMDNGNFKFLSPFNFSKKRKEYPYSEEIIYNNLFKL
jgi:hypothetical protein